MKNIFKGIYLYMDNMPMLNASGVFNHLQGDVM